MPGNTNISIIQLIKSGDFSVNLEINKIKSDKDINIHLQTYLDKSNQFQDIQMHIEKTIDEFNKAKDKKNRMHFDEKLQNLYKVRKDFICNTLYLADTLSKITPHSERLKKAFQLFEEARIEEADAILKEIDLLNDQFELLILVEYQRNKMKILKNDFGIKFN